MKNYTFLLALLVALSACDDTEEDAGAESPGPEMPGPDAPDPETPDPEPETPDLEPWTLPSNPLGSVHPEPPANMRDMHLVNDEIEFTRPYVPGYRTTMDGRVGVRVQGGFPGTERIATSYSFYLFAPEKLEGPIMPGAPGAGILAQDEPVDVVFPPALEPGVNRFGHHAICDATTQFPTEGERPNPYPCGPDDAHDCYDITMISSTAEELTAQYWGTPVTIEVAAPKTVDARIVRAELGEPVRGLAIPGTNELLEPAVTRDGKLLTARLGQFPRNWTNPETGETKRGFYDLVYFPPADDMAPCDVTGWTEWNPMSHAPYDPRMKGKYGLAAYPFRDSEGNLIPDGDDLGGTYPWVDREGANVFMTAIPGRMVEQSEDQYPRRCVHEGCEQYEETVNWDRGFLVAGLWTHGKFVLLDSMINHLDWAIGVRPEAHFMVDLFTDTSGDPVSVRLGSGRFIGTFRNSDGPYPAGYTRNANILDSVQNLLNQHENAQPVTPRDVVWLMSNGVATDEVVFDDYLDPNAFIVSEMQASVTQHYVNGDDTGIPHYWNGQKRRVGLPAPIAGSYTLMHEDEEIHVQNAATSLGWNVPSFGLVEAGEGRIEPAALGGIRSKGFWLSGHTQITYGVPSQPHDIREHTWTHGIFVDPRDGARRVLLSYPDGTLVELEGSTLRYVRDAEVLHEVTVPPSARTKGWRHLGWRVSEDNTRVELLVDGFPLDRFEATEPMFELIEGAFVVGHRGEEGAGFRGWIDDLKILAHDVTPEVACNHAHGTLVRVDSSDDWAAVAALYPDWAHAELAAKLGAPEGTRYACFHDHRKDFGAHLRNIPDGTVSVREALHFPEGPLRHGTPRPDSSENTFCLSCHHEGGQGGLGLDALAYQAGLNADDDPRRQPSQPPRRVFGNIPADWLPGSPAEAMLAPPEGVLIDRWVLDAPE